MEHVTKHRRSFQRDAASYDLEVGLGGPLVTFDKTDYPFLADAQHYGSKLAEFSRQVISNPEHTASALTQSRVSREKRRAKKRGNWSG